MRKYFLILLLCIICISGYSQESLKPRQKTRILLLLDASGSMLTRWGRDSKWETAVRVISEISDSLSKLPYVETALRVYGHQSSLLDRDCNDTRLEVPFSSKNTELIKQKLRNLHPKGITPIALSLEQAATDFPNTNARNTIILITDGAESCFKDPCAAAYDLQAKGIALKPLLIGLDIPEEARTTYECIGKLFNSKSEIQFKDHIERAIYRALSQAYIQVYLEDIDGKQHSNVNMTFYDNETGYPLRNLYHKLNKQQIPDTIDLDPIPLYSIVVHTIPPTRIDSVFIQPGKVNEIHIPVSQGEINLQFEGDKINTLGVKPIQAIIKAGEYRQTVNLQEVGKTEKYLSGTYDIEFLTLPRIQKKGIELGANEVKTVSIPRYGTLQLTKKQSCWGGIFLFDDSKVKKIYELKDELSIENIFLQPGSYHIIYRAKSSHRMHETVDKVVEIQSGQTLHLQL